MPFIRSFEITGLAGARAPVQAVLQRDTNVIFGLNGAGKTTLLRVLHSALAQNTEQVLDLPFDTATVTVFLEHYNRDITFSLDRAKVVESLSEQGLLFAEPRHRAHSAMARRQLRRFAWDISPDILRPVMASGIDHGYLSTTRLLQFRRTTSEEDDVERLIDVNYERALQQYWVAFFSQIQASARRAQERGLAAILREVIILAGHEETTQPPSLTPDQAYEQTVAFLRRQFPNDSVMPRQMFEQRYDQSNLLQRVVELIDEIESSIATTMAPRTRLQEMLDKLFQGRKLFDLEASEISVRTPEDAHLSLRGLSSGEKQILLLLVEALRTGGSTLIIDEPELSLHIVWQRELLTDLHAVNPHLQLIVATHSPEIVASVSDDRVIPI